MLDKLFRRKKRYVLALARRGRPLVIEEFEAKNMKEAVEKAKIIIDELNPNELPEDVKHYKYFRVIELETDRWERIRNPFHEGPAGGQRLSEDDINELIVASLAEKIPDIISRTMDAAIEPAIRLQSRLTEVAVDSIVNTMRNVMEKLLGIEDPDKAFKEELRKTVIDLLNNPEKIAIAWRIAKEGKIPVQLVQKQKKASREVEESEQQAGQHS